MAKSSGLGDNFYVGGYDLSGDVASVDTLSGPTALLDVTPVSKSANQRINGLRDGDMQFTSYFEYGGTGNPIFEHDALSRLPLTDQVGTYFRGTTILNQAACINGKQINYDPTRDNTGNLTLKVEIQANSFGLEWGKMLTAGLRTDGSATTGTFVQDNTTSATTFGAQAYLQLVAFTGTSVDVTIAHCATSGGTYTTLIDFAALTAVGSKRVAVSNTTTVQPYLKVNTAGTFTNAVFAVMFNRNPIAGVSF
jgi:hypothetical protein